MNIEICGKCQHWCEYFRLYDRIRMADLWIGCTMPNGPYGDIKFRNEKYAIVRNGIRRNKMRQKGKKPPSGCYNRSPIFKSISELVKDEYNALRKKFEGKPVIEECPYLAEQKIEEWNK